MKRLIAVGAAILIAGAAAGAPHFSSAQSAPQWSTFHGSGARSGSTTANGPVNNTATNIWSLPKAVNSSPVVDANGVAYIGDDDNKVYAFDPKNPLAPKWSFATTGKVYSTGTLSSDGKTLYIGSQDAFVYALDTATGKKNWSTQLGGPVNASPLLSPDGASLYVPDANGNIYGLKTSDGSVLFQHNSVGSIPGSLALSPDGSTIWAATVSGFLYAYPSNGTGSSTAYYLAGPASSSPAIDGNGAVYVQTTNGAIESFTPGSTTARWIFPNPNFIGSGSTPAIGNGIVVVGGADGHFYDLNPSTGQPVWSSFPLTGASINSSPAISANGIIYVGSNDGYVYGFNAVSGQNAWQPKKIGAAISSSPAIASDGSMWIGTGTNDQVYRFATITPPGTPPPGPTQTATATPTPGPTGVLPTPAGTSTGGQPTVVLKASVKPGQKQVIKVTTLPNTIVRFRVNYPNGDHQSHHGTSNGSGSLTYSYKQGGSKVKHNLNLATVIVKAGAAPSQTQQTAQYKIGWGKLDLSVEPRSVAAGAKVGIFLHTTVGKRVTALVLLPNRKYVRLRGHAGPKGFAHWYYKAPKGVVRGSKHTVRVYGSLLPPKSGYTSQTTFKIQ